METRQKKIFVFRTRSSEYGTVSFRNIVYKTPAAIEKQERIPDVAHSDCTEELIQITLDHGS